MKKLFILLLVFTFHFWGTAQTLVPFKKINQKWIFVDSASMKPVLLKDYEDVNFFSEGLAAVKLNNKWGFIDKKGKEVITPIYDFLLYDLRIRKPLFLSNGLAALALNGKAGFIDKTGKVIIPFNIYNLMDCCNEGFARVRTASDKYGFIDMKSKTIFDTKEFFHIENVSDGLALVNKDRKYGFIDTKGNKVIPLEYDDAEDFHDGLALVKKNGYWAFIDKTGKNVFSTWFGVANEFSDGLAFVYKDSIYGYIDKTGKYVIKALDRAKYYSFQDGLALVHIGFGNWGLIDKTGKQLKIPTEFNELYPPYAYGVIKFKRNLKYGLLDKLGREIAPPKYDRINSFVNGITFFVSDKKFGFMDSTGKEIIPATYTGVLQEEGPFFENGFEGVYLPGVGAFYIDRKGREFRDK